LITAIAFVLIPALFLQGCFFLPPPSDPVQAEQNNTPEDNEPPPEEPRQVKPPVHGKFTLRYDPNSSLNPLTALNRDNILLSSLMYESLFVLDGKFNAEPVLCERWSTSDNVTFSLEIRPNIPMSDGSLLTAEDVAYSLRQAMLRGRYVNRFSTVASVAADGPMTVTVELYAPNNRFTRLLDIPIIKSGQIDYRVPVGSGPYVYAGTEEMRLDSFAGHRDFMRLPISTIYLKECNDSELTSLFDDGELSLITDDPYDAFDIRLNRLHDTRYYDTTTIQFIGFNANSMVLRDSDVRRAIGCAVDRQFIVENIMPRHTIAAPLALSPGFDLYDVEWEYRNLTPLQEMAILLDRAGLSDFDQDSFLELHDGFGGYSKFSLEFIVNSDNSHKVRAAHTIADALRRNGLNIIVRELPWDRYTNALQIGDFDMYYGETMLGADFNLSPLLLPGPLNYGRTASSDYRPLIEAFLGARDDEVVQWAAKRLCDEITVRAPFIPILYKRYAVFSPMGAISDASPSQSSIFRNITEWTIDTTLLS